MIIRCVSGLLLKSVISFSFIMPKSFHMITMCKFVPVGPSDGARVAATCIAKMAIQFHKLSFSLGVRSCVVCVLIATLVNDLYNSHATFGIFKRNIEMDKWLYPSRMNLISRVDVDKMRIELCLIYMNERFRRYQTHSPAAAANARENVFFSNLLAFERISGLICDQVKEALLKGCISYSQSRSHDALFVCIFIVSPQLFCVIFMNGSKRIRVWLQKWWVFCSVHCSNRLKIALN